MSGIAGGAILGLVFALGLLVVWSRLPILRRPSLAARVLPYLGEFSRPSRLLIDERDVRKGFIFPGLTAPALYLAAGKLGELLGGTVSVRQRLRRSASVLSVEAFRVEQVLCGAAGLAVSLVVSAASLEMKIIHQSGVAIIGCGIATVMGVLGRDYWLTRSVTHRERCLIADFPTVVEMLALSVSAGEGVGNSLERLCRIGHGPLIDELKIALTEFRSGLPLITALDELAARIGLTPLVSLVDALAVAIDRGTPLAEVLRAQAADARSAGRRALMESGGRREIAMMIPVVFIILPTTVVFALFPGFYGLTVLNP
jgi:tight adherence protein C